MPKTTSFAFKALWAAVPVLGALFAGQAQAVPSYARQTGQECAACHIGAYGPQLTPFGIKFKLGGYVDSDGKGGKIPLSGMVVADYNRYKVADADNNQSTETKTGLAEASLFLAGKMTDHLGTFVQVTHNGKDHSTAIDQVDVRYANTVTLSGQEALVGVSVNNNPTVQDPFNTLMVWGFPYTNSERVPGPGVDLYSTSIEQREIGVNAYALLNDNFYGELGVYNSISPSMQSRLGSNRFDPDTGKSADSLSNSPYWRLGYFKDQRTSAWHVGLLGTNGTLKNRDGLGDQTKFNDYGLDGSYQFLGNREHVVTVNGSYVREHTTATKTGVDTGNTVKNYKLAASYTYLNTYGATLGYFKGTSADQLAGNRGFIYQADWTPWGKESSWNAPWANLRLGVQYIAFKHYISYDEDAEVATVLDKPSNKNSLRVFAWTSF